MTLRMRLMITYLMVGLLPVVAVSIYSYVKSSNTLQSEAIDKLKAVREVKGQAVKRYFEVVRDQVITFSDNLMTQEAMMGFSKSFKQFNGENRVSPADLAYYKSSLKDYYQNQFGKKYKDENGNQDIGFLSFLEQLSPTEIALQYYYISNNSNPLGNKENLDRAADKSTYSSWHAKIHPIVKTYLKKFGYYDIFLVDIETGNVVYSVYKELDYATSLLTGPYKDTNIAVAFKKARELSPGESILVDYQKYIPSYEAPASFIASPIWQNGKKIGIAMFQMPIDRLNAIMNERAGMGETGETYLFGKDKLMRSDSFIDKNNYNVTSSFKHPSKGTLSGNPVELALAGKEGAGIDTNYLGNEVIAAYSNIDILGLNWGLIAEVSSKEAFAAAASLRNAMFLIIVLCAFGIVFLAFSMSTVLVKKLSESISSVADRLFTSAQEVGMASENMLTVSTQLSESSTEQASSLQETVASIDEIRSMIQKNASAAEDSAKVSGKSNSVAIEGKDKIESMKSSIAEIYDGNQEIAQEMEQSNRDISKIVQVIGEIGNKTKVINDIVFQTKLLSFNASVEAARAGEHGKGFAVVAEEVGNLAAMSGKAALEITEMLESSIKQVTDIVESTKQKVDRLVKSSKDKVEIGIKTAHDCGKSLDEILQNVGSVNGLVREIAAASSEQSTGVQEVTEAMRQLDAAAHQNSNVAHESSNLAKNLMDYANTLNHSIADLRAIVGGDKYNQEKESGVTPPKKNVTPFSKKPKSNGNGGGSHIPGKKVSGSSEVVPESNDPRFENF